MEYFQDYRLLFIVYESDANVEPPSSLQSLRAADRRAGQVPNSQVLLYCKMVSG